MKKLALVCAAMAALEVVAAPAAKVEPVAAGFPQWQGLSPKNHVMGREVTGADLRHRVTVVVEERVALATRYPKAFVKITEAAS